MQTPNCSWKTKREGIAKTYDKLTKTSILCTTWVGGGREIRNGVELKKQGGVGRKVFLRLV